MRAIINAIYVYLGFPVICYKNNVRQNVSTLR